VDSADANYSINPWMNPSRPGDAVDPSQSLSAEELVLEVAMLAPPPPSAGYTPRLTGYPRTQPGIGEVLGVGPATLLKDNDAGVQSTLRPATGAW
jgi:hypothetical protein